jgi:hypothetical protein
MPNPLPRDFDFILDQFDLWFKYHEYKVVDWKSLDLFIDSADDYLTMLDCDSLESRIIIEPYLHILNARLIAQSINSSI